MRRKATSAFIVAVVALAAHAAPNAASAEPGCHEDYRAGGYDPRFASARPLPRVAREDPGPPPGRGNFMPRQSRVSPEPEAQEGAFGTRRSGMRAGPGRLDARTAQGQFEPGDTADDGPVAADDFAARGDGEGAFDAAEDVNDLPPRARPRQRP
jgi:hypothetical protein